MTIIRDPDYRYYNCNLQTPNLKCENLKTETLDFTSWKASGINLESGYIPFATAFQISPSSLSQFNAAGELTVYLKNDPENYTHVLMYLVTKTGGVLNAPLDYQKYGNFTTLTTSISGTNTVTITIDPGAVCRWIWRGV